MQQKTMTFVVTLVILAVTALGIYLPPIGEETAKQMRKAATSYEQSSKFFKGAVKEMQDSASNAAVRNPIAKNLAPAEAVKANAAEMEAMEALLRLARAYKALEAELRKRSSKH